MKKTISLLSILSSFIYLSSCGGRAEVAAPALGQNASALVPAISSVAAASVKTNAVDSDFNYSGIGSIPVFIFGDYTTVSDISGNDASVAAFNLEGVFSNAAAIVDSIPTATAAANTVNADWQGYTFPVVMAATEAATSAAVSPFNFGTRSGSATYTDLRTATASCTDASLPYEATMTAAWKNADNTFYLLYAEDNDVDDDDAKYVIQGNYNSSTGALTYNQANRYYSSTSTKLVRIEVTGNVETKLGLIRVIFVNGNYKVSVVSKGVVGTGDTVMKVKLVNDGSALSAATESWMCVNSAATIEDFQTINFTSTVGSYASGKIQIAATSAGFTGTCATSTATYVTDVTAESFFVETDAPNTSSNYYDDLR